MSAFIKRKEVLLMIEKQNDNGNACNDSSNMPQETIGDYISKYNGIHQQILSLENQIRILERNRERYKTSFFDPYILRLNDTLDAKKGEIGPVILILSQAISWLTLERDREYLYRLVFLGQTAHDINLSLGVSEQYATCVLNRAAKIHVPDSMVKAYGEI